MAKSALILALFLVAGAASGQDLQSYTPSRSSTAPTFANAVVVRVDSGTGVAVFRSESGEEVLAAGPEVSRGLSLRPGQKVLVAYRKVMGTNGRESHVVMEVREASATSGQSTVRASRGNIRTVRILRTDGRRRTVTVFDDAGRLVVLPVTRGMAMRLTGLGAGDTVTLTLTGVAPDGGLGSASVVTIAPATAASFALPGKFPTLTATFVRVNAAGNEVTVGTTAGELTFPVSASLAESLRTIRPGDSVSLDFDVNGVTQAVVSGSGAVRPASLSASEAPVASVVAVTPVAAVAGTAVVGAGPTSPFVNNVPSVPAAAPVVTAVLPPAGAKAPLTQEDVGAMQAQGLRDLDAAAVALAPAANDLDVAWARFKSQCLPGSTAQGRASGREWYLLADGQVTTPGDDACRATHTDLTGRAKAFRSQLEIVEDAARKADVLPARVREVLDRHRL